MTCVKLLPSLIKTSCGKIELCTTNCYSRFSEERAVTAIVRGLNSSYQHLRVTHSLMLFITWESLEDAVNALDFELSQSKGDVNINTRPRWIGTSPLDWEGSKSRALTASSSDSNVTNGIRSA
jgi:hypothetical protein